MLDDKEWLDHLEAEHENLRAALEWAISNDLEKALHLVYIVGNFWVARDFHMEARRWCRIVLDRAKSLPGLDDELAKAYSILGWSSSAIGDHVTGQEAAEAGIERARRAGDDYTLGRLLALLALACIFRGDFPATEKALVEAESLARQTRSVELLASILTTRAQLAFTGYGELDRAKEYLDEALLLSAEMQNEWGTAISLFGMGRVVGVMGDLVTARAKFRASADLARKMGNKRQMYSCYSELAHVLRENGELDEPLALYRDLLPKWNDLGHRAAVAHELECVAYILAKKEDPLRAVTILAAADALRKTIGSSPTPREQVEYEQELASLREAVDRLEFDRAWENGQALSMDQAIALALREDVLSAG